MGSTAMNNYIPAKSSGIMKLLYVATVINQKQTAVLPLTRNFVYGCTDQLKYIIFIYRIIKFVCVYE